MQDLETVSWQSVRLEVKALNPELFEVLDAHPNASKAKLFRVRYPYGESIIEEGTYRFPIKGRYVAMDDPAFPSDLREELSYSLIPLSIVLEKGIEVYVPTANNGVASLITMRPGDINGLFEVVAAVNGYWGTPPLWNVSSGARSITMLPKLADRRCHTRLQKEFQLYHDMPRTMQEQWGMFKALVRSPQSNCDWYSELLLFGKDWFDQNNSQEFSRYLNQAAWREPQFVHEHTAVSIVWNSIASLIATKKIKVPLYLVDTLRYLFATTNRTVPVMSVLQDDEIAPRSWLQEVYVDCYALPDYLPTLVAPRLLDVSRQDKGYYAMLFPMLVDGQHGPHKTRKSVINDLRQLKSLFELVITKGNIGFERIASTLLSVNSFRFFHHEHDEYRQIESLDTLLHDDPSFEADKARYPERQVCTTSAFFKGCIQVSHHGGEAG